MKKVIYKVISFVIFIMFVSYIVYIENKETDMNMKKSEKNFKTQLINGKIIEKYIDSKNHNKPTIQLIDGKGQIVNFDLSFEKSPIYEYLQPNDSIFKSCNDSNLIVKRNGKDTTFNVSLFLMINE